MRALALCLLCSIGGGLGCRTAAPRAPLGPLAETVALTEVTAEGERVPITGGGVTDVDINSRIEVRVDRARVEAIFARAAHVDAAAAEPIRAQLVALTRLTREQTGLIERFAQLVARFKAAGPVTALPSALEADVSQLYTDRTALNASIASYARSIGQAPGDYFASGLAGVLTALDAERRRVLALADKLTEPTRGLRWRMQAVFARGTPIHLANYDTYPDGTCGLVDKLMPQTTPKELATQLDEARQLAKNLKDLAGARQAALRVAAAALQEQIEALLRAMDGDANAVEAALAAIRDDVLQLAEARTVKTSVQAVAQTVRRLRTACAPLIDAARSGAIDRVTAAEPTSCARIMLDDGPRLITEIRAAAAALSAVVRLTEQPPARPPARLGALLQPLRELVPKLKTIGQLKEWADRAEQGWKQLLGVLDLGSQMAAAPVWLAEQQTDLALEAITDTAIDLRCTARKEDDLLHFRPSLTKADGSAALAGTTTDFRVVRMGLYIDVSAGVAFVNKRDDAWGPFSTAPGVVAAVHYRFRPDSGGARFMNALRPGVGIHFFNPDLDETKVDATGATVETDSAVEIGVGGSLLLFGDLLQVGLGYDLQADTSYWYVGFGLDRLANLGVRFSPGS
ncbi:MAG TPA: hypothetical protein VNO30_43410 [Kofleriaceae bacterium]|nr:hypothetical protein [Kofleriaceae bacterium]